MKRKGFAQNRLSRRLNNLNTEQMEHIYKSLAEIDTIQKNSNFIRGSIPIHLINQYVQRTLMSSSYVIGDDGFYADALNHIWHSPLPPQIDESTLLTLTKEKHYKHTSSHLNSEMLEHTPPEYVKEEVEYLLAWYNWAISTKVKHPLIVIANTIFELLAIHPFKAGNHRTSMLLTHRLLLEQGYDFNTMTSYEKTLSIKQKEYREAISKTHATWRSMKEDASPFILFFIEVIGIQAQKNRQIIETISMRSLLSPQQYRLWQWVRERRRKSFSRQDAVNALVMPTRTIENSIKKLVEINKLEKQGQGRATRYAIKQNI